jgi:2-oxoglutarate dehydrogenase E1 component
MPTYLNNLNAAYIEELQLQYKENPESLDSSWRYFFDGLTISNLKGGQLSTPAGGLSQIELEREIKVLELIQAYREMGYLIADVNPLDRGIKTHPLLELTNFGLSEADLEKTTEVGKLLGMGSVALRDIIKALKIYYCSPVSVESGHIEDPKSRQWVQKRVENNALLKPIEKNYQRRALDKLTQSEVFETFLHKRFVGQKRFSLEGSDTLIPVLDFIIDQAGEAGADEIIFGMAHRGRLNVLANIFGKDPTSIFAEFSGNIQTDDVGDGDVKYHLGHSSDTKTFSGKDVHLSIVPNPSHLEAVNGVVMGITRAKQKLKRDPERMRTIAVLIHGDAAFAGQGIIYETLNMSALDGYTVGGTIHIIINNQIGFTTSQKDARSTPQATDVAKMLEVPIFHVNADEPDAALRTVALALEYRNTFKRDVVIDLIGYRRFGHNEGDEPSFTQPLMYKAIDSHPRVREIYANRLKMLGVVDDKEIQALSDDFWKKLDEILEESKKIKVSPKMSSFGKRWEKMHKADEGELFKPVPTGVSTERLSAIGRQLTQIPGGFNLHPKLTRFNQDRLEMLEDKRGVDWSLGEAFAFGSLLTDGFAVRLSGQDVERGTFSHRQSVFYDGVTGARYVPLNHLEAIKTDYEPVNSLLSEYGVLGFEFGQSLANPNKLTIWEAQFGDFGNGAQIIFDQFVSSSAVKWQRFSGLVMLLPHGYEGQGPEHSSGRVERYLQACAQNNIQVCNVSTPAQYFHVLRRQLMRDFRIPLIIMTPKSLLRHPKAVSPMSDFQNEVFHEILDDSDTTLKAKAKRVVLCSGKIYYELLQGREASKNANVAIVRVEQFYPFAGKTLAEVLASYKAATEFVWAQEEPQNMGGYVFMNQNLALILGDRKLTYAGRQPQASPANGYMHLHHQEQQKIVKLALGEL